MVRWDYGSRPLEPKEIDGLLVPPGKASSLLTDQLFTGLPLRSEPAQEKWLESNQPYISLVGLVGLLKLVVDVMTSYFWIKSHRMEAAFRHDHSF